MFFFFSKILDIFLSPLTWAFFLALLAVPWRKRALAKRRVLLRKRACAIASVLVLYLFSIEPTADFLWNGLEKEAVSTYDPSATYDAVVLLGGVVEERAVDQYGRPAFNENVERLTETFELLKEGKARYALLSGAGIDVPYEASEVGVLKAELVRWGIAPERIVIEDKSRNTRENAVYSAEVVRARGWKKVLVVTSAFHVPRARGCFSKVGLAVDWLAVDYRGRARVFTPGALVPRAKFLDTSVAALRERAGRWIYRARGYSD